MYPEHEGSLAEAAALPMQKKMFKENELHKNVKKEPFKVRKYTDSWPLYAIVYAKRF